jgi:hypothetical protein
MRAAHTCKMSKLRVFFFFWKIWELSLTLRNLGNSTQEKGALDRKEDRQKAK